MTKAERMTLEFIRAELQTTVSALIPYPQDIQDDVRRTLAMVKALLTLDETDAQVEASLEERWIMLAQSRAFRSMGASTYRTICNSPPTGQPRFKQGGREAYLTNGA